MSEHKNFNFGLAEITIGNHETGEIIKFEPDTEMEIGLPNLDVGDVPTIRDEVVMHTKEFGQLIGHANSFEALAFRVGERKHLIVELDEPSLAKVAEKHTNPSHIIIMSKRGGGGGD